MLYSHFFLFYLIVFVIFGSLLGSFCNVVILRMAQKKSVIFPPSQCPHCEHRLAAIDLVPVLSWLRLRGKCRYCSAPISCQYPLVEATVALIIGSVFYHHFFSISFIASSSKAVIWFIVLVISLKQDIKSSKPYIYALFYFFILDYFVKSSIIFNLLNFVAIFFISFLIALIARQSDKKIIFTSWFVPSFIFLFFLCPDSYLKCSLALLVPAIMIKPKPDIGKVLFFIVQYAGMLSFILYR